MQEQTGVPSSQTVQAEHAPRLQAIFVPVRPSGPRRTSASVARESTFTGRSAPFTLRTMSWTELLEGAAASPAEAFGARNPRDAWATHALAHVLETANRQGEGVAFLKENPR